MNVVLALALLAPLPPDVRLLACAAQTEAHPLTLHRDEAARWVAHVALNRATAEWWGTLPETLASDFHGIGTCHDPELWAVDAALAALSEPDPTDGSLFVLSLDDLERLGHADPVRCVRDGDRGFASIGGGGGTRVAPEKRDFRACLSHLFCSGVTSGGDE